MVRLDRAYIPALALTSQGSPAEGRRALEIFRADWTAFRRSYPSAPERFAPGEWPKMVGKIEGSIGEAEKRMAAGDGIAAHEALEHVREILLEQRVAAKVDYFVDRLTRFHAPMEEIVVAARDRTAATATGAWVDVLRRRLPEAEAAWAEVLSDRDRARQHLTSESDAATADRLIDQETQSLAALRAALAADDASRIAERAAAIKPAFAKLFMLFGDFARVRASL